MAARPGSARGRGSGPAWLGEGEGPARPSRACSVRCGAAMAGLEVLYCSARAGISCPQDALVCGIHWELIQHGYRCLGAGEQVRAGQHRR